MPGCIASYKYVKCTTQNRSHAPAIESHRALAAPTRSTCFGGAAAATAPPPFPGAWVVLLPSGDVVCSPEELHLSSPLSSSLASSGTCSTAAAAAGTETGGGAEEPGEAQDACLLVTPPTPTTTRVRDNGDGHDSSSPPGAADGALLGGRALAFDHVYDASSRSRMGGVGVFGGGDGHGDATISMPPTPTTTAILYGVVGSPAMMGFHRVLKAAVEMGTVRYAFRHALPYGDDGDDEMVATTTTTTPLQGYGVFLDVKNMEYQSFDSSGPEDEVCLSVKEQIQWERGTREVSNVRYCCSMGEGQKYLTKPNQTN